MPVADVIDFTLECFLEHEEIDSQAIADRLVQEICRDGLAVGGTAQTLRALTSNQVDLLVIAKDYETGSGFVCRTCGRIELEWPDLKSCPRCRSRSLRTFDVRGELVRLAKQRRCSMEVVERCDALMAVGGVGCLLRFLRPEDYARKAA